MKFVCTFESKWHHLLVCSVGGLLLLGVGCVPKQTLRQAKQDPVYQRAAQAHQRLASLTPPASCQGQSCRTVLGQEKSSFAVARGSYKILLNRGKKSLAGVLARCQLGALHVKRMALLKRMPEPSKTILRKEIITKIRASFTKRGIALGGQEQMLRRPNIQAGIAQNIVQWSKKRKSDIGSMARQSQLRARHHYKKCFEDAERHGELKQHMLQAKRFLKSQGL